MEEVNSEQLTADQAIKDLVAGKSKNIHETMIQIQKAELSLKTMMQVRNKILEAYKEIMRMQV
jgi:flagellar hook-basal body complex protein FliE